MWGSVETEPHAYCSSERTPLQIRRKGFGGCCPQTDGVQGLEFRMPCVRRVKGSLNPQPETLIQRDVYGFGTYVKTVLI